MSEQHSKQRVAFVFQQTVDACRETRIDKEGVALLRAFVRQDGWRMDTHVLCHRYHARRSVLCKRVPIRAWLSA